MSLSNANLTPANIVLTPMRVTFNGVDLGGTTEGVDVLPKYKIADIKVDQSGDTVIDGAVSGQSYVVKLTLAETADKAKWKVAFPHGHQVGSGPYSFYSDLQIGDKLSAHAFPLILHPLSAGNSDLSGDIMFYKAVATSASEIKYGPDKQSGLKVEFHILPDTGVIPWRFMLYGDPSIGLVAASAGAAVAGSNTGNGTVTAIAVTNAGTKTETVTLTVLDGGGTGNDIKIVGSVSGILGVAHLASGVGSTVAFTAPLNQIAFTVTQGSVEFVAGDSFTIATTASNYA